MTKAPTYDQLSPADKARRLSSEVEAEYLDGNLSGLADTLTELAEEIDLLTGEALYLAALVANAGAKHTAAGRNAKAEALEVHGLEDSVPVVKTAKIQANAVGRLHNAAKHARLILDERCPECRRFGKAGVAPWHRPDGKCVCGRVLGELNEVVS